MTTGIHTVTGVRDPNASGRILTHEHLILDYGDPGKEQNRVLSDPNLAVDELEAFKAAGGTTIVEVTPPDLAREPAKLRWISERSGVDVVMGSGWYRQPFYPAWLETTSAQALADRIVEDLVMGVEVDGGDRVPAGIIGELGVDGRFPTGLEERVHRAAARASNRTGAPITTHSAGFAVGLDQLDLFEEEDVDPAKVIIGHADTYLDVDYHLEIVRRGAWVQFDTCGRAHLNPDSRRAQHVVALLEAGHGDRLLLSSDRCLKSDLLAFGGVGYAHVLTTFFDLLRDLGVDQADLDRFTIDNPRRALTW